MANIGGLRVGDLYQPFIDEILIPFWDAMDYYNPEHNYFEYDIGTVFRYGPDATVYYVKSSFYEYSGSFPSTMCKEATFLDFFGATVRDIKIVPEDELADLNYEDISEWLKTWNNRCWIRVELNSGNSIDFAFSSIDHENEKIVFQSIGLNHETGTVNYTELCHIDIEGGSAFIHDINLCDKDHTHTKDNLTVEDENLTFASNVLLRPDDTE